MTIPLCSMYLQQVVQDSTEKNRGYRVLEIANRSFEEVVYIFLNTLGELIVDPHYAFLEMDRGMSPIVQLRFLQETAHQFDQPEL